MKILMLSTDQKIFDPYSDVHQRMIGYGNLFEELHIVIFTRRGSVKNRSTSIAPNTFAYSTNSRLRVFYFWSVILIARRILRTNTRQNDWVVTTQDPFETGLAGYMIKLFCVIPLQIQIHTDFLSKYFFQESFKNKIRAVLGRWLVTKADGIRVVSERIKSELIKVRPEIKKYITVLPIFVEIEKIRSTVINKDLKKKYPQFDFIILMASRLTCEKNIGMAMSAMKSITTQYPKTGLVIVGSGPEEEALRAMTVSHQLQNNVAIEPWTNDLISYYKTADCYVLSSNYEGYGRTVVEAMAAGCPVVMTDVGIARWLVQNGVSGVIVPVCDSNVLAESIERIETDTAYRTALQNGANAVIENMMSKDKYLLQYKALLKNL